jgi:hypothetical protein
MSLNVTPTFRLVWKVKISVEKLFKKYHKGILTGCPYSTNAFSSIDTTASTTSSTTSDTSTSNTVTATTPTTTRPLVVYFNETFSDGNGFWARWVQLPPNTLPVGTFQVVSGGLQTMNNGAAYRIYSVFTPFSNVGNTLTLEYTLKTTQTIACSGNGLIVYDNTNSYFWFGPDTCSGVSILDIGFKNSGVAYKITKTIDPGYILNTAVAYKLVVPPNGTYSVYINNAVVASDSLAADFAYNGNHPSGPGLFQYSGIYWIEFTFRQDQAGSVFDEILLTTS